MHVCKGPVLPVPQPPGFARSSRMAERQTKGTGFADAVPGPDGVCKAGNGKK